MNLRRDVLFPLENKEIHTEQAIKETKRLFHEYIQDLIDLVSIEQNMRDYCKSIDKEIPHWETWKDGFITSLESLQETLEI